jgi:hypothetical protein
MTAVGPFATWSSCLVSPAAPKTAMSALELDGYLTGVIVTPQAAPIRRSLAEEKSGAMIHAPAAQERNTHAAALARDRAVRSMPWGLKAAYG